ncbi:alpha-glucuronidase [Aureococcus anophagefferens]|nr:alpha-glucuronidase [Aureococcus anophagefferens]
MPDIAKDAAGACRDHAAAARRGRPLRRAPRRRSRVAEAIAVFEKLAATIAALLNDGGVCLIAYCPRSDVDGVRLFAIERDAAEAPSAAAPPPPPTFAPIAFDFVRPPLDDPLD